MEEQRITIVKAISPFSKENELISFPYNGETLLAIRDHTFPGDDSVVVSVNGQPVPNDLLSSSYVKEGDYITLVPIFGREVVRAIAYVVVAIIAVVAAYLTYGASLAYTTPLWSMVAAGAVAGAVNYAGGLLINALLPPLSPDTPSGISPLDSASNSPSYSWSAGTTQQQGIPIPRIYGKSRSYGNIISTCISTNTNLYSTQNYMNVLLSLGQGPVNRISDIKINKQNVSNYTGVDVHVRNGLITQDIIPNFNDTKVEYDLYMKLVYGTTIKYTTEGDNFDGIEIEMTFSNGLGYQNDQGSISNLSKAFSIKIRKVGDTGNWTAVTLQNYTVAKTYSPGTGYWSLGQWIYHYDDSGGCEVIWGENYKGSSIYSDHVEGVSDRVYLSTWSYDNEFGWGWSTQTIYGNWRWIADPDVTIYNQELRGYVTLVNSTVNSFKCTYYLGDLDPGQYDIEITSLSPDYNNIRYLDSVYLTAVREVTNDDFTYPRLALVGIKALATDQLSGSFEFSCLVEGLKVRVYRADEVLGYDGKNYRCIVTHTASSSNEPGAGPNWETYWEQKGGSAISNNTAWVSGTNYSATESWRVEFSENPAWVCFDLFTQPVIKDDLTIDRYEGIDPARLVLSTFQTWADFCDVLVDDGNGGLERRIIFGGIFDAEKTLWESVLSVCKMGRGMLVRSGYDYSIIVDQAGSEVAFFSSGNVVKDSFKETFLSLEDRAGEIEVTFRDRDLDYEKNQLSYFDTTLNRPTQKVSVDGFGIPAASQAWRTAKYQVLCNLYQKRFIEFDVAWDAIRNTVGDIFKFSHDIPKWGSYQGRIVSATSNTITLDQSVTLEAGKTYSILLRLTDDTLVTKVITSPAGTYTTLSISGVFTSVPTQYDPYALGETGIEAKLFRITGISRSQDTTFKISAVEYSENIYTVDTGATVIPPVQYSAESPISIVTGLALSEVVWVDDSGNLRREIHGTFTKPTSPYYVKARIYYREAGAILWSYWEETTNTSFIITGVSALTDYEVSIISVGLNDIRTDHSDFTPGTITTTGGSNHSCSVVLSQISGLQIAGQGTNTIFSGKDCKFTWNPITGVDTTDTGAGEESSGAGSYVPPVWFKAYEVCIYTTGGTLVRTDYPRVPEYVYTYEHNVEDGEGTALYTFEIRVKATDGFGNSSEEAARLTVENSAPADITGLSASSIVGGVLFSWDKCLDADHLCYYYRTKVSTDEWSLWEDIEDNTLSRVLTASEITAHTNKATIYIEVFTRDYFGNVSVNAVGINAIAGQIADNIFQLIPLGTGVTGEASSLIDGNYSSGGVIIP